MRHTNLVALAICGALSVPLAGCLHGHSVTVGRGEPHAGRHGPPPHAPAHGYRHKHHHHGHDVELVFDSGLGVYAVVGMPDHYFWDGFYLRVRDGHWYASARLDGGWERRSSDSLPHGLARKWAKGKGKKHKGKKGKGHHPAKGRW